MDKFTRDHVIGMIKPDQCQNDVAEAVNVEQHTDTYLITGMIGVIINKKNRCSVIVKPRYFAIHAFDVQFSKTADC